MAVHDVRVELPSTTKVFNEDVRFTVRSDGGQLGVLTVSQGGVGWYPSYGKKERHLTWEQFDKLISDARG